MNYSILINSCDAYSDALPMMFHLLKKQWVGKLPTIYLNTESLNYCDDDINIINLNAVSANGNRFWGARLIDALSRIEDEYVLMLLDDFYFEQPIKTDVIHQCCVWMEENHDILAFQLNQVGEYFDGSTQAHVMHVEKFPGFGLRNKYGQYTLCAGPCLWRKYDLINLTKERDSPWEWEFFGSKRTWFYGMRIYCWKDSTNQIFSYDVEHGGAIHRGKWVGYKMHELERKFDFPMDYGNREIEEDWMKDSDFITPPPPIHKRWKTIIRNRLKIVTNTLYGLSLRRKRNGK